MQKILRKNIIEVTQTVKRALLKLSMLEIKNLLVIDKKKKFLGSITDGDLRRYTLKRNFDLNSNLKNIYKKESIFINHKKKINNFNKLKKEKKKILIPILNKNLNIVDIKISDENKSLTDKSQIEVLVLAGGEGKRLRPITKYLPKPLIRINEKTVIEILIKNLIDYNFHNISISTNYYANKIERYLKREFIDFKFKFLKENKPLGTAGPISKLHSKKNKHILLVNSDIITQINFDKLISFHLKNKNDFTLAAYNHRSPFDYGVIKIKNKNLITIEEKPVIKNLISSGIYIFKSDLIKLMPKNTYVDITNFISKIKKKKIGVFKFDDYWVDIGNFTELDRVRREIK